MRVDSGCFGLLRVDSGWYQSPENIKFFLGTTRTFQKLPTFLAVFFFTFVVYFGQNDWTYFFITIFFGIFASHYRKKYPKGNISLVKYQIFLLFMKIFLGTRFLGSSKNLNSGWYGVIRVDIGWEKLTVCEPVCESVIFWDDKLAFGLFNF